ncbi:uncharacterized protein LOC126894967 [Daktulosphaira vitifoliae]|uniref:uncharacterized protein LOC126894967 n=1 Tax=Daktulosphaira vitifoliae TaxID=58002 RepID=UPI0021A99352|nr:uncharacterized protein LOC126894967 [Daktulosphaira vitifoliae]
MRFVLVVSAVLSLPRPLSLQQALQKKFIERNSMVSPSVDYFAQSVGKIIDIYIGSRTVIMFADEVRRSELGQLLLATTSHPRTILPYGNVSLAAGLLVYFIDDRHTDYDPILKTLPLSDHSRHMLLWNVERRVDLHRIQGIFEIFWRFQLIDVVVMVPLLTGNVRVYTFSPYSESRCNRVGSPIMINVWNSWLNDFMRKRKIFGQDNQINNLHRCALKCLGVHRPPTSTMTLTPSGWTLGGSVSRIVKFIQKQMNFTADISVVHDGYLKFTKYTPTEDATSPIGEQVKSRKVDLAFGRFTRIFDMEPETEFIKEDQMDCFTWSLPSGIGRDPSSWLNYLMEFSAITWTLIVGSIMVAFFITVVLSRSSHGRQSSFLQRDIVFMFFYSFSTFIGASVTKTTNLPAALQIFLTNWLLYALVVTSAYQAYLGSIITIPRADPEIDDQHTLLKTNLNLAGRQQMYFLINSSAGSGHDFRALVDRYHILPPEEFSHFIKRILTVRDTAVLASRRELFFHARQYKRTFNDSRHLHVFQTCVIESYSSIFILRKGSPFRHRLMTIMSRLSETGIMQYWDKYDNMDDMVHGTSFTNDAVLSVSQVYGPFIVLFIGLALGTFAFIGEMIVYSVSLSKPNKKIAKHKFLH